MESSRSDGEESASRGVEGGGTRRIPLSPLAASIRPSEGAAVEVPSLEEEEETGQLETPRSHHTPKR